MRTEEETADIYRRIGIILRSHGAFGVYILSSKTVCYGGEHGMRVEIVADRLDDPAGACEEINGVSPDTECILYDGEDPDNFRLLSEAREDGIRL